MRAPDYWPGYDIVAQPVGREPVRISVKARTRHKQSRYVTYRTTDVFDWMAIVLLPSSADEEREIYLVPQERIVATAKAYGERGADGERNMRLSVIPAAFARYRNLFSLDEGQAPPLVAS